MWRTAFILALALTDASKAPTSIKDLTFLTRDGCVNTPDMVNNLDDALKALGWPKDYQYINIGKLPANDVRTGYPTPTLFRSPIRRSKLTGLQGRSSVPRRHQAEAKIRNGFVGT